MTVPDDPRARRIFNLLQQALQPSIEADPALRGLDDLHVPVLFTPPWAATATCPRTPATIRRRRSRGWRVRPRPTLARSYNTLAAMFGLRSDCTEAQI